MVAGITIVSQAQGTHRPNVLCTPGEGLDLEEVHHPLSISASTDFVNTTTVLGYMYDQLSYD